MKRYLLDTSALLTLRDDEPGAQQVANILAPGKTEKQRCMGCFITLMEVFYRVWRDEGQGAGHLAYQQCLSLPIEWMHETSGLLEKAAELKATYPLSLADAWIAACAELTNAELVHKDPEFEQLPLAQVCLPFKSKHTA